MTKACVSLLVDDSQITDAVPKNANCKCE